MSKGLGRLFWFNWVTSKVLHMLKKIHWHSTLLILRCFNGTWKSNVFLHCTSVVILVVTSKNTLYLSGIVQLKLINKFKKKKKKTKYERLFIVWRVQVKCLFPFSFFWFLFLFLFFLFSSRRLYQVAKFLYSHIYFVTKDKHCQKSSNS